MCAARPPPVLVRAARTLAMAGGDANSDADLLTNWVDGLLDHATAACPAFIADNSEELRDILPRYLGSTDLARLAQACKLFRSWTEYAGRPKLGLARWSRSQGDLELPPPCDLELPVWQTHGSLGEEPAMAVRRAIRLQPRIFRTYVNEHGKTVECDLPPGTGIDSKRTTISVDLVWRFQNRVCEPLYRGTYWKKAQADDVPPREWEEPQPIKFMIRDTLSNRRTPPEQCRLRVRLHAFSHARGVATDYTYYSPEFWVADIATLRKPSKAVAEARKKQPSKRMRRA